MSRIIYARTAGGEQVPIDLGGWIEFPTQHADDIDVTGAVYYEGRAKEVTDNIAEFTLWRSGRPPWRWVRRVVEYTPEPDHYGQYKLTRRERWELLPEGKGERLAEEASFWPLPGASPGRRSVPPSNVARDAYLRERRLEGIPYLVIADEIRDGHPDWKPFDQEDPQARTVAMRHALERYCDRYDLTVPTDRPRRVDAI
jgi:hypothetical protein